MAVQWASRCSLLVLLVLPAEDAARKKRQVRYLPHGIQLPAAPRPGRRSLDSLSHVTSAGGVQLFGDPLPGDNFSLPNQKPRPRTHSFGPRLVQQTGVYQIPNEHDLAEPLVTRQALGPPPPSVNLWQLSQMSDPREGPLRSGQPAYGLPPLGPFELSRLSPTGQSLGPQQIFKGRPWYGLRVPTPMGPYQRRLKPKPPVELQPPRNIDDPNKRTTKVPIMPFDSWQGAQQGAVVSPPAADQLAPLAPPRMPQRTAPRLRQSAKDDDQEYSLDMLRHMPPFNELPDHSPSTRWRYKYAIGGSLEQAPTAPPPALLGSGEGLEGELSGSDGAALFSDSAKPVEARPPSNTFDYILL